MRFCATEQEPVMGVWGEFPNGMGILSTAASRPTTTALQVFPSEPSPVAIPEPELEPSEVGMTLDQQPAAPIDWQALLCRFATWVDNNPLLAVGGLVIIWGATPTKEKK